MFSEKVRLPVDFMFGSAALEKDTPFCPFEYVEWLRNSTRHAFAKAHEYLK